MAGPPRRGGLRRFVEKRLRFLVVALPAACRDNTPERVARALKPASEQGLLPPFPFGTDFTPVVPAAIWARNPMAARARAGDPREGRRGSAA